MRASSLRGVSVVASLNIGAVRTVAAKSGVTGIDKQPVSGPVWVQGPDPGGSGLAGDPICDTAHHGGADQAVYAYAREDLDAWQAILGDLRPGSFGENLTTRGVEVTGARIGEHWRVGDELLLQVTAPRIPCRTFAVWLQVDGWVKTFIRAGVPGAYLRVLRPGHVRTGDPITVENRPDHDITVGVTFRALTTTPDTLPRLLTADDLPQEIKDTAARRALAQERAHPV